jgi:ABC-type antimicrobial peptide transport system permease subunit
MAKLFKLYMMIVGGVLQSFEGVRTCLKSESLATIMDKIVKAEVCILTRPFIDAHVLF